MTIPEKIKFHLTPEHGAVIYCYDQEMADSLDDFLTEQCGVEFSIKFGNEKVTFFLANSLSEEVINNILQDFIKNA